MKKFLTAALLGVFACSAAYAYKDGTYTGEGEGKEGKVTATVTVSGGKITAIDLVGHDTPGLWDTAKNKLPKRMIKANSAEVKPISGASLSSRGIIDAVKSALQKAN